MEADPEWQALILQSVRSWGVDANQSHLWSFATGLDSTHITAETVGRRHESSGCGFNEAFSNLMHQASVCPPQARLKCIRSNE